MRRPVPVALVALALLTLACGGGGEPTDAPAVVVEGERLVPVLVGPDSRRFDPAEEGPAFDAIDGDPATGWRADEGIYIEFGAPVRLTGLEVIPGCAASAEAWEQAGVGPLRAGPRSCRRSGADLGQGIG